MIFLRMSGWWLGCGLLDLFFSFFICCFGVVCLIMFCCLCCIVVFCGRSVSGELGMC